MTDSTKDFPVAKFKGEMKTLVKRYEDRVSNQKNRSSSTEPVDKGTSAVRDKPIMSLTEAEYAEYINSQFD